MIESRLVRFVLSTVDKDTGKSFSQPSEENRFNAMLKDGWIPGSMVAEQKENMLVICFSREKVAKVAANTKRK